MPIIRPKPELRRKRKGVPNQRTKEHAFLGMEDAIVSTPDILKVPKLKKKRGRPPKKKQETDKKEVKPSIYTLKKSDVKRVSYRDGWEGWCKWCEDFIYVPVYHVGSTVSVWTPLKDLPDKINPKTGKSYKSMWEAQKLELKEGLRMVNGEFVYKLIVLCWMRGEGKSWVVCFIQLWKFFNWPQQYIVLGANSKDQVKFVHYDIMRDFILNSPPLLAMIGGDKNVREKEIRLRDSRGRVRSFIRAISSFSGIVSNITGYTFSEMFDMKNPKFFVQLDGSVRNIPNALGAIDSTVSEKTHVLYTLYNNAITGKTKQVFFSYRCANKGEPDEYWNPNQTGDQLNDYRIKFPFGEFERYFQNLWEAGSLKPFTPQMLDEMRVIGVSAEGKQLSHGKSFEPLNHRKVSAAIERIHELENQRGEMLKKGIHEAVDKIDTEIQRVQQRLILVETVYKLKSDTGKPRIMSLDELNKLSDLLETDFYLACGYDFGDPYAKSSAARTVVVAILKGLPFSKTDPNPFIENPVYVYIPAMFMDIPGHSIHKAKLIFNEIHEALDGIDLLCGERYGSGDFENWCEDRNVQFLPVAPSYDRQRDGFKLFYQAIKDGMYKLPPTGVVGYKRDNIEEEEILTFEHNTMKKWFGSPEKMSAKGIQDDSIFASMWPIWGAREKTAAHFRARGASPSDFGVMFGTGMTLLGDY